MGAELNDQQPTQPQAGVGLIESVIQSYSRLARGVIFFVVIGVIIFGGVFFLLDRIYSDGNIQVETNEKGGFILKLTKGTADDKAVKKVAQFILPASKCWLNTGIDLEPGDECRLVISGNVHLGLGYLVRQVQANKIPAIEWTDATGNQWADVKDPLATQQAKRSLLLNPGDKIGNIVGYLGPDMESKQFVNYFMKNRDTIHLIEVNDSKNVSNNFGEKRRLYLSVNDILIDTTTQARKEQSRIAYEGRPGHDGIEKWDDLLKEPNYHLLWFNDNVGGFLVNVTIVHKDK